MNSTNSNLELSVEEMHKMGSASLNAVASYISDLPGSPCSSLENAAGIVRELCESAPESGTAFDTLLQFLFERVIPVSINTAHPAYMGFIPGGGLFPTAIADFLASATNRYVGVWIGAPAAARIEANVLEWFAELMGYPTEARGILTSGGSMANFSAIVSARDHCLGDELSKGTVYLSDQAHHSVAKAAKLAGIAERNIRVLRTDEKMRAVPDVFDAAIKKDLENGLKPFLVVGNAGTTNSGAVDPLAELADVCRKRDLWYHIDAAYGGFFNLCNEGAETLLGVNTADSVTLDPHKGLFLPYGTGCLLVKDGERLRRAHLLTGEYLQDQFTAPGEVNFTEYSPEQSRSFRGLGVWLPLKLYGLAAFRANLAEKLSLARWLYQRLLLTPGFECPTNPDLSIITFRYRPRRGDIEQFNIKLLDHINRTGRLYLSSTRLKGAYVIRVCILSFRTHQAEVEQALQVISSEAQNLDSEFDL